MDSIWQTANDLKMPPVTLSSCLFLDTSRIVQNELQRRSEARSDETTLSVSTQALHKTTMASKGIPWALLSAPPWLSDSPWYQICPVREREVLAFYFSLNPNTVSVDSSCRIDMARGNLEDTLPTITPGAKTFLNVKKGKGVVNRFLLGHEALMCQGYPVELLPQTSQLSDTQKFDLAGNAFPSTCLMALLLGIFANLPPMKVEGGSHGSDMDDNDSLLHLVSGM